MKKLSLFLLCAIVLLSVCGCVNENKIDKNKSQEDTLIRELSCSALSNVKYRISYPLNIYFITNDNDIYVLNTGQLYSNNENCKKINNESVKAKKIINGFKYYVLALDNNNIIYAFTNNSLERIEISPDRDVSINNEIPNWNKSFEDNNVVYQSGNYVLKTNGKLYKYEEIYEYEERDKNKLVLFKDYDNEIILEFVCTVDEQCEYIKTDRAFYTSIVINKEQCEKYADVECIYDIVKNDELTSKYNDIVLISGNSYITKDGKQYEIHE